MTANYSQFVVRIERNACLEKLLITRRAAKIVTRRATVAIGRAGASSTASKVDLFKRISNKPFARRRSVCVDRSKLKAVDQTTAPSAEADDNSTLNDIDTDKENDAPKNDNILLPFLPSIETPMRANIVSTLLDSAVPNSVKLPTPITPIAAKIRPVSVSKDLICMEDSLPTPIVPIVSTMPPVGAENDLMCMGMPSVIDSFVPNSVGLPAPIIPIQPEQSAKRAIPGLIPYCDLIAATTKKYGPAKRLSNTSQLILGTLHKFEEKKNMQQKMSRWIDKLFQQKASKSIKTPKNLMKVSVNFITVIQND